MKCKICGAKLKKDGNICKSCYEKYCKDEELKKDTNVLLKIHRKYLPKYQITKYWDYVAIGIFSIIGFLSLGQIWYAIACFLLFAICIITALLISKQIAINTTCTFFEKKIVWKYKDNEKIMPYEELKEVTYFQDHFQKKHNLANLQFRPVKGIYLINGFEMKNIPDFKENIKKINEILEAKKEG